MKIKELAVYEKITILKIGDDYLIHNEGPDIEDQTTIIKTLDDVLKEIINCYDYVTNFQLFNQIGKKLEYIKGD